MLKGLALTLNEQLKTQARRLGWFYISGIAEAFKGHGYCTGAAHKYFVTAEESLASQGDTEGTIHPNFQGSQAIGMAIAKAVQQNTLDAVGQRELAT